jgi:hypothetical protein
LLSFTLSFGSGVLLVTSGNLRMVLLPSSESESSIL